MSVKKRPPANIPPIPPPPTPTFQCEIVGSAFPLGDKFCQLLRATAPREASINTATLIQRGVNKSTRASMSKGDARFFAANLRMIPCEFEGYRIVFPQSKTEDGLVRYLEKKAGEWWCTIMVHDPDNWTSADLLARIVDKEEDLLIDIEAIMRGV